MYASRCPTTLKRWEAKARWSWTENMVWWKKLNSFQKCGMLSLNKGSEEYFQKQKNLEGLEFSLEEWTVFARFLINAHDTQWGKLNVSPRASHVRSECFHQVVGLQVQRAHHSTALPDKYSSTISFVQTMTCQVLNKTSLRWKNLPRRWFKLNSLRTLDKFSLRENCCEFFHDWSNWTADTKILTCFAISSKPAEYNSRT